MVTTEEFIRSHPWPAEWLSYQRLDYIWEFRMKAGADDLWPYLSDTSATNQGLRLPVMHFEEREGRMFGRSVNAGITSEWEEVPWQWVAGQELTNARIYSKGFARYVRAAYYLQPAPEGGTLVYVYFGWVPRSIGGWLLLRIAMPRLLKGYTRWMAELDNAVSEKKSQTIAPALLLKLPPYKFTEDALRHIDSARRNTAGSVSSELFDRIIDYIRESPDDLLYRLRVPGLAREWNVDENDLLRTFLYMTREGLLTLSWDIVCPHCRGVREEVKSLGSLPEEGSCDACDIDFDATGYDSIEVTFHVHPSVRPVAKVFYCSAEPARKPHILMQRYLGAGEDHESQIRLQTGRYRLRLKGSKKYFSLKRGRTPVSVDWKTGESPDAKPAESDFLRISNPGPDPATFILESREEDQTVLHPGDLFLFPEFRDVFPGEALRTGIRLDIGDRVILFTDIVGSTRFYHQAGDAGAFSLVQKHFVAGYQIVEKHRGVVVKTIGDAIMAGFSTAVDATRAALDLQNHFSDDSSIRVRVAIHRGKVLAVNFNTGIDFFGNTVNMASKIEKLVSAREIGISEPALNSPGVSEVLSGCRFVAEKSLRFDWMEAAIPVRIFSPDL